MTSATPATVPSAPLSPAVVIPLLPEAEQKKATARLAVFNKASNARALMNALPSGGEGDTGLAFHRIQLLRKAGKVEEAAKIILAIPPDPKKIAVLDEWWAERRELAYGALKMDRMKLAYELVKDAGPLTVNPLKEQTFMAGWIAFRYLNKPGVAEKHFKDFAAAADGPLSRAKSAYWLGRVADARGDKAEAVEAIQASDEEPRHVPRSAGDADTAARPYQPRDQTAGAAFAATSPQVHFTRCRKGLGAGEQSQAIAESTRGAF